VALQRRNHRRPSTVEADLEVLRLLEKRPDYKPSNPAYSIETLKLHRARLLEAQEAEAQALAAYKAARAAKIAATWAFHETVQRAKLDAFARFGSDSPELRAIVRIEIVARARLARITTTE
jgi:hypothetical protein